MRVEILWTHVYLVTLLMCECAEDKETERRDTYIDTPHEDELANSAITFLTLQESVAATQKSTFRGGGVRPRLIGGVTTSPS